MIIGAGQLGSRHLQGALLSHLALQIYVVDPSAESLNVAKQRAYEVEWGNTQSAIELCQEIPKHLNVDVCIIATTANHRFNVFSDLVNVSTVSNIIFEKVLFQKEQEYIETEKLLLKHNINAWVNCPRRVFPTYIKIKELLKAESEINMTVNGSGWGMACNSVHFLDLFAFLSGNSDLSIDFSALEKNVDESKRGGFFEVLGKLQGQDRQSNTFELFCESGTNVEIDVTIKSKNYDINIHETDGHYIVKTNGISEEFPHKPLYQSQLTNFSIEDIIHNKHSHLTPYQDSMNIHRPFIKGIKHHIELALNKPLDACPIT